jgi:hypothetical protein
MKYLVEFESADKEELNNAKNALTVLPFVKNVELVDNDDTSYNGFASMRYDVLQLIELRKKDNLIE